MRQRALPAASPSRTRETVPSQRKSRNEKSSISSTWEISTISDPSLGGSVEQFLSSPYPNGYQHHRRHVALQNVHLFYRKPLHVSDADYRAFVGLPKPALPPAISKQCCLNTCTFFSWIGVGFFLFVYLILKLQPLYIPHSLSFYYAEREGKLIKVSDPSNSPLSVVALHTLFAYLLVALVCQYFANPNRFRKQRYQNIPEVGDDSQGPSFPSDDSQGPSFPNVLPSPIGVYQGTLWERTIGGFRQWMLIKGYRRGKRKPFEIKTV